MNTFFNIFSDFPVKLVFFQKNKQIFSVLSTQFIGEEINLKFDFLDSFKIQVYPLNKTFLPYSLEFIENNEKVELVSPFANLFQLPENNYILTLNKINIFKDNIIGDKIEVDSSAVKKLTFLKDLRGRGKVETFSINDNKLIKKDEYFVYLSKNIQKTHENLILLDFFQSVYAEDFSTALKLLSHSFSQILNKETCKSFFGEFCSCKIINYFSEPTVALFYEDQLKVFGAKLENNKISDIYEIN